MKLSDLSDRDLRQGLEELLADYVHALNDGEMEKWPTFFTEDGLYEIVSRENVERGLPLATWRSEGRAMIEDRVTALRQANLYSPRFYRHLVGSVRLAGREGAGARFAANFTVFETPIDGQTRIFLAGKYEGQVREGPEGLRLGRLSCIYDTIRVPNSIVGPI